jgi:hypothetical protein
MPKINCYLLISKEKLVKNILTRSLRLNRNLISRIWDLLPVMLSTNRANIEIETIRNQEDLKAMFIELL